MAQRRLALQLLLEAPQASASAAQQQQPQLAAAVPADATVAQSAALPLPLYAYPARTPHFAHKLRHSCSLTSCAAGHDGQPLAAAGSSCAAFATHVRCDMLVSAPSAPASLDSLCDSDAIESASTDDSDGVSTSSPQLEAVTSCEEEDVVGQLPPGGSHQLSVHRHGMLSLFTGVGYASTSTALHPGTIATAKPLPRRTASDLDLEFTCTASALPSCLTAAAAAGGACVARPTAHVQPMSLLDAALLTLWDDRQEQGLFRYDVSSCVTKVLPGTMGFVAQLNVGRATQKRPTECKLDQVVQPFDPNKFNFMKARVNEVLMRFQPSSELAEAGADAQLYSALAAAAAATAASDGHGRRGGKATRASLDAAPSRSGYASDGAQEAVMGPCAAATGANGSSDSSSSHLVMINVSPIEHGHVLLIPHALDALPQLVTPSTALVALQFAREIGSASVRVGYNSLGAYGTINHLHFHAYQLHTQLPCERAATAPLTWLCADMDVGGICGDEHDDVPHGAAPSHMATASGGTAPGAGGCAKRKRPAAGVPGHAHSCCSPGRLVRVSTLQGYPVRGFVIQADPGVAHSGRTAAPARHGDHPAGTTDVELEAVALVVGRACMALSQANIAHNLLVADAGRRVFLWPQCFAERALHGLLPPALADTGVNPAAFEIAGHVLLKRPQDYDCMDEAMAAALLQQASLLEDRFAQVAHMCFGV